MELGGKPVRGSWVENRRKGLGDSECVLKSECASVKEYREKVQNLRVKGWLVRNIKGGVVAFEFVRDYENWKNKKEEED